MKKIAMISAGFLALSACVGESLTSKAFLTLAQAESNAEIEGRTLTETERRGYETVCKKGVVTGSLTRVNQTCLTRNEWRYINSKSAMAVGNMQANAAGGAICKTDAMGGCN